MSLLVGFKRSAARAEFLSDPAEIQQTIEKLVVQNPKGAGYLMGWDAGVDRPETADFSLMIERVLVVQVLPKIGKNLNLPFGFTKNRTI